MPKREIVHSAGRALDSKLKRELLQRFTESDVQRLERLGGRILFSITAPYSENRGKNRKPVEIDDLLVKDLQNKRSSPDEVLDVLRRLTIKELRKLTDLIGQPVRSSANASEIQVEVLKYLQAEDFWRGISGNSPAPR